LLLIENTNKCLLLFQYFGFALESEVIHIVLELLFQYFGFSLESEVIDIVLELFSVGC